MEIRKKFLTFFKNRGHAVVLSASLIPKNDPSVLFTTAGMQQFKDYYTGKQDPMADFKSQNTVSVQKCLRTGDIDEVGDDTHLTFFEMLGNFSFGGYWKQEAINFAYEFVTKELGQTIDYVSVFKDEESKIPPDNESRSIWQSIDPGISIREHGAGDNFWGPTGIEGPCGPTTEIYVDGVEVWNIVFNEYYKTKEGEFRPLEIKGIDTGMGLERLLIRVQQKTHIYQTDLFAPTLSLVQSECSAYNERSARIIADHIRSAVFLLGDGVIPANKDHGYILRRLLRRAVLQARRIGLPAGALAQVALGYQQQYKDQYPEVAKVEIIATVRKEQEKFEKTLEAGLVEFEKGTDAFILATTYGFPIEMTEELAKENGTTIDRAAFDLKMKAHQTLSRSGAEQKFKGGLSHDGERTTKLHTAHHLLLAALQRVLGKDVKQRGSNITDERLRMDFSFDRKLTDEEKRCVESLVNEWIQADCSVGRKELPKAEAEAIGAEMEFKATYPSIVSVYFIEDKSGVPISKEFCGGPHVERTGTLGTFKIQKEEAVASGIRRIKATLT